MGKPVDKSNNKVSAVAYWDYRMVLAGNGEWGIREVFYDKDDVVLGWTGYPAAPWGDTPEELAGVLTRMQKAADRPPLVEADLSDEAFTEEKLSPTKESDKNHSESSHPNDGSV